MTHLVKHERHGQLKLCLHLLEHLDVGRVREVPDTVVGSLETQPLPRGICPPQPRRIQHQRHVGQRHLAPFLIFLQTQKVWKEGDGGAGEF